MTQLAYASPVEPALPFKDRRTGLRVYGILFIVFGSLGALMALFTPLSLILPRAAGQPRPHVGETLGAGAFLLASASAVIWAGIGSLRLRRWARPVILASAWAILVMSAIVCGILVFMMPQMLQQMRAAGGPAGAETVAIVSLALGLLLVLAVPAVIVWFYRSADVRATLGHFDPFPRFTDGCPTPILAISIVLLWTSAAWLSEALGRGVVPVFATSLTGVPAVVAHVLLALVAAWLARMFFNLRRAAWPIGAAFLVVCYLSAASTALFGDSRAALLQAGHTQAEIDAVEVFAPAGGTAHAVVSLLSLAVGLAYLLYSRRFLVRSRTAENLQHASAGLAAASHTGAGSP